MQAREGDSPRYGSGWRTLRAILVLTLIVVLQLLPARAGEVIVQGSTTVAATLITPNLRAIEAASRQRLTLIPNKSNLGLIALFEHRATLAMISTSLANG